MADELRMGPTTPFLVSTSVGDASQREVDESASESGNQTPWANGKSTRASSAGKGPNLTGGAARANLNRVGSDGEARQVTVALTGAIIKSSQTNQHFDELASSLRDAGLIQNHEGLDTFATFPSMKADSAIVARVLTQLDHNGDGIVDAHDGPVVFTAVGFSWGGYNAARLMTAVLDKLAPGHQVRTRLILIEPYQPDGQTHLRVDPRIEEVHNFRQSQPPEGDCSSNPILGSFKGKSLECGPGQDCSEYDFGHALVPGEWNGRGRPVDHCRVPAEASDAVWSLVHTGSIMRGIMVPPRQEPKRTLDVKRHQLLKP